MAPSSSNRKARPERSSASARAMSACANGLSRNAVAEPAVVFEAAISINASIAARAMPSATVAMQLTNVLVIGTA